MDILGVMDRGFSQKGQALVIILLVSTIGLTIGLSLASRAAKDTAVVTNIEESARAFSAAEAGLQESSQYIGNLDFEKSDVRVGGADGATYDVEINPVGGSAEPYQFPGKLKDNQSISIWLVEHNNDGTIDYSDSFAGNFITVCWEGDSGVGAALETTLYFRDNGGKYRLAREVYNQFGTTIVSGGVSASASPGGIGCGGEYQSMQSINFSSMKSAVAYSSSDTLLMLKVRPITDPSGGNVRLAVDPSGETLKSQGEEHLSIGKTAAGQTTKIKQFISHPVPPELFDVVIYANTIERY